MKAQITVLDGKLDDGIPHIWFDEGEVASAKPLIYRNTMRLDGDSYGLIVEKRQRRGGIYRKIMALLTQIINVRCAVVFLILIAQPFSLFGTRIVSDGYGPLSGNDSGHTPGRTNPLYDNTYYAGSLDETIVLSGKLAGWSSLPGGFSDVEDLYEFTANTTSITLQCTDYDFPSALRGAHGFSVKVYDADSIFATATFILSKSLFDNGAFTISNLKIGHNYKVHISTSVAIEGYTFGYEITLKPVDYVNYITVSFNANGGIVSPSSYQYTVGTVYGYLPPPTRSGYRFKGWSTSSGASITVLSVVSTTVTTLYAQWEKEIDPLPQVVSVVFYMNDPSGLVNKSTEKDYVVGSAYGTFPSFSLTGYSFLGWFTDREGGTCCSENSIVSSSITTLYAHWTLNQVLLPDIEPYTPSGWNAPVVATTSSSSTVPPSSFLDSDTVYIQWAVANFEQNVLTSFDTALYVDGMLRQTFVSTGLNADHYTYSRTAYPIGTLSAGTHTIKIVADANNSVQESDENNNEYALTIIVGSSGVETLASVALSSLGLTTNYTTGLVSSNPIWRFDYSTMPSWLTQVEFHYGDGNTFVCSPGTGSTTMNIPSGPYYFTASAAANAGAARTGTWKIYTSSGTLALTVTFSQATGSATDKANLIFDPPAGWPQAVYFTDAKGSRIAKQEFTQQEFTSDDHVYLNVSFKNAGTVDAGAYLISSQIFDSLGNQKLHLCTIDCETGQLAGNTSYLLDWDVTDKIAQLSPGTYTCKSILDCNGSVDEENELDNVYDFTFEVKSAQLPTAPDGVAATDGAYFDKVLVSWIASSGATSYNLYRSTISTRPSTPTKTGVTSPYSDTTAAAGMKYYYWVSAVNSAGESYSTSDMGYRAVSLSLGTTAQTLKSAGGQTNVSVTANTEWNASADVSWITFATSSGYGNGTLLYTVAANASAESRTGTITIVAGSDTVYPLTRTITVTQMAGNSDFTIVDGVLIKYNGVGGVVIIPDDVTEIGERAFYDCKDLMSVTISEGVTIIGKNAFYDCSGLVSVTISSSVTNIGGYAFAGCSGLTSVTIPSGVTSIKDYAFSWCVGLTSVTISDSVTSIGYAVFNGCGSLTSFSVAASNPAYSSRNGSLCTKDGKTLVYGVNGDVTIPSGVTSIAIFAFAGCDGLKSVTIPSSVTSIGGGAFFDCSGLTSVTIPSSVTSIGDDVFYLCSGLTSITIPSSVTNIGDDAFWWCDSLTTIYVDAGDTGRVRDLMAASGFDVQNVTFIEPQIKPEMPINVEASDGAYSDKVLVSWTASSGATSYNLFRSTTSTRPSMATMTGVTSPYSDTTATPGTKYYYWVSAVNSAGASYSTADTGYRAVSLSLGDMAQTFESVGGSTNVSVTANTEWSASADVSWITLTTSSGSDNGTLSYRVASNDQGESRSGTITVIAGSGTTYPVTNMVMVTQSSSVIGTGKWNYDYGAAKLLAAQNNLPMVVFWTNQGCSHCVKLENAFKTQRFLDWQADKECVFVYSEGDVTVRELVKNDSGLYPYVAILWPSKAIDVRFTGRDGLMPVTEGDLAEQFMRSVDVSLSAVARPVIVPTDGTTFDGDNCTVTISCATPGAAIYYNANGRTPRESESYRYGGPFTISETSTIVAFAVKDGVSSDFVEATITKIDKPLTLKTALDSDKIGSVTTGGASEWTPMKDASAKIGGSFTRSGTVGMEQTSWMETTVYGKGILSFWWKVSCEPDPRSRYTYDHLTFTTEDGDVYKVDGESGWQQKSVTFTDDGVHVVRWTYSTDDWDEPGYQDCAWVDGVEWTGDSAPGEKIEVVPGVELPISDVDAFMTKYPALAALVGGDREDFVKQPSAMGKLDVEGNQMYIWQDIVAGTDPTDQKSKFTVKIAMDADGQPVVTWEPALNGEGVRTGVRTYTVMGSNVLSNDPKDWTECGEGKEGGFQYFKVSVKMP